ncbi:MAG: DUF58 domain-containing protein, partial [Lachnospiraceae bacterium]|nr:DUF58 domain-containing protein [Lachnospiraceae bacterium]
MKKKVVVKGIINYIVAMLFSIIFALFLDANMGWFMLLALILAPVLSVFFAWISSRYICVFCEMEEALLSKKDTCMMQVHVQNKSIFPTTPIAIKLTNEAGVRSVGQDLSISVMSRMTKSFEIVFQAQICGKSTVGIEDIRVMDYLGLFTFPVKNVERDALKRTVAVIPDIAEISARDDNLIKAMQTSMHTDDSEDTVEAAAYAFGGFPGYDSRDYVPGDPLKRVNWKQSAKRNRLLVRLDDELASKSISVVLDSVFERDKLDVYEYTFLQQYKDCEEEELFPKIAEDAVENALGMMQVLIKHNYTVNFYVMFDGQFQRYEISDENDLEDIRLELAYYGFSAKDNVERIPEELSVGECVSLFSTPNNYEEAICAFAGGVENPYTTIYSVVEEARKQGSAVSTVSLKEFEEKQEEKKEEKKSTRDKVVERVKNLAVPYFLALLLSLSVFGVFDIPVNSWWTIVQAFVCAGTMVFCEYVKKHRVIGTMLTTILVVGLLSISARIVFSKSFGLNYMYWFLSGGDSVDSNFAYLMTLVMVFTVFFCMVTYYFIRVLYRTSFLLLVSMLPFVIYVKVMQDINMVYVVLITVLNIAAFMINTRGEREKDKRKLGQAEGFLSMLIYAIVFVFIGLAVPKEETIFYYMFENAFLGGNVSTSLPEEYSTMSEFSGNADGFNELNDRKLYVISSVNIGTTMYLKRQTFDCYDFEQDRWYPISGYADTFIEQEDWADWQEYRSVVRLAEAFHLANEYEPGFLEKYGMQNLASSYTECRQR